MALALKEQKRLNSTSKRKFKLGQVLLFLKWISLPKLQSFLLKQRPRTAEDTAKLRNLKEINNDPLDHWLKKSNYHAVCWIKSETPSAREESLRNILFEYLKNDAKTQELAQTFKVQMKKQNHCLLVFDNVEQLSDIKSYLPTTQGKGNAVLITTRDSMWENSLKIQFFTEEESLCYLDTFLKSAWWL